MNTTLSVQALPISQIRPNPANPRHVITQEMVDTLAASLQTAGLKNPIKVRKTGLPTDEYYEVISGHIRLAAAQKLGWQDIPALVLDLSQEQAMLEAILDNRGQEMTWLDLYQAVETMVKLDESLTQQKIGEQLEIPQQKVSRAIKLLKKLNQAAREAIYMNHVKPDGYQVPENVVFRLADLGDPTLVEKALGEVLDKRMTEKQVADLVAQVNAGAPVEVSPASQEAPQGVPHASGHSVEAPATGDQPDRWVDLPEGMLVKETRKGYRVTLNLSKEDGDRVIPHVIGLFGITPEDKASLTPANPAKPSLLQNLGTMIEKKTGLTPKALGDNIKSALEKDAKQAANYEVRYKMRRLLKNIFS